MHMTKDRQMKKGLSLLKLSSIIAFCFLMLISSSIWADNGTIPVISSKQISGVTQYSLSLKIVALMALLSVLPAMLITMTAFTRVIVVLAILRQAIGIPNVPSNQILIGLSLIMTLFVMMPMVQRINEVSYKPYIENKIQEEASLENAVSVLKTFMYKQTRKKDLEIFYKLAKTPYQVTGEQPLLVLMPAYITSELKTAFEIGMLILLPFLIIDMVVASVLMSMGMMMLSPMVVSLPIKLLFFVMVDGWTLIITSLITSFRF